VQRNFAWQCYLPRSNDSGHLSAHAMSDLSDICGKLKLAQGKPQLFGT
jgi:hypothetical protein